MLHRRIDADVGKVKPFFYHAQASHCSPHIGIGFHLATIVIDQCGDIAPGACIGFVIDDNPAFRFVESQIYYASQQSWNGIAIRRIGGHQHVKRHFHQPMIAHLGTLPNVGSHH